MTIASRKMPLRCRSLTDAQSSDSVEFAEEIESLGHDIDVVKLFLPGQSSGGKPLEYHLAAKSQNGQGNPARQSYAVLRVDSGWHGRNGLPSSSRLDSRRFSTGFLNLVVRSLIETNVPSLGSRGSRVSRVLWMLEELGEPYEFVEIGRRSPEAYALNPSGKVPILIDGD